MERAAEAQRGRIVVTFDLLGRQVLVTGEAAQDAHGQGSQGPQQGPLQGSLFVPSGVTEQGHAGPSGQDGGSVEHGGVEVSPEAAEGPLRAVCNPAAHVVPTFATPSTAQRARVAVPR